MLPIYIHIYGDGGSDNETDNETDNEIDNEIDTGNNKECESDILTFPNRRPMTNP